MIFSNTQIFVNVCHMIKSKTIFILYTIYIFKHIHLHLYTIIYSKQNPEFAILMHETISSMLICAKFNIIYQHIDIFYNKNDVLSEDGFFIYKYEYFESFKSIVAKLERLEQNKCFDIDTIV